MFDPQRVKLLADRVRPTASSQTRLLPVLSPLAALLPDGGLRRGTAVRCGAGAHGGALSLALALAAGPSAAGAWCAVVGVEDLGALAAAGLGVNLDRLAVIRAASPHWALATGILVDGVDVVIVAPPPRPRPSAVRTLAARARDRGAVLLVVGERGSWAADHELVVEQSNWHGLADGAGRLQARRVTVVASGRGSAVRPVRQELWLPAATGNVVAA